MSLKRGRKTLLTLIAMVLLCLFSSQGGAQTALSEIAGTVKDSSGATIPGVSITLTNTATGIKTALLTNEVGLYYTRSLPPGTYQIEAELPGFKTYRATGIELRTGQVLRHDITLEVGEITQQVQVVGETGAVELQKDSGDISAVINEQTVKEMPTITRKTLELIALTPGVTMTTKALPFAWNTAFFSIAGNPGVRSNMYLLDGASFSFPRVQGDGGQMAGLNPPPEVTKEMRVITNNYSAEFGQGMGGVIMITTKSGTNAFEGQLYYYGQNDALDANNFFGRSKPPNRYHDYGGLISGPIVKDRTHFLFHIDRERWLQWSQMTLTLPTLKQRQGDFSETFDARGNLIPIYDPATTKVDPTTGKLIRDQFPGNKIPANRFDPVGAQVLKLYPDPNQPGTITGANNYNVNRNDLDHRRLWKLFRVDHEQTEKDKLYGRFIDEPYFQPAYGPYKGTRAEIADPFADGRYTLGKSAGAGWTRTFSPTTLSDFRFGWLQYKTEVASDPAALNQNWAGKLGLQNLDRFTFPGFSVAGYAPIGAGGTQAAGQQFIGYRLMRMYDFTETISHIRGKHGLRMGMGWKDSRAVYIRRGAPSGFSSYDTQATNLPLVAGTGNAVASFLLGEVALGFTHDSPAPDVRSWFMSLFFQDDWRATQDLTLNLGIRYEYDTPKIDALETFSFFNLTKINPVCNCPGVIEFSKNKWTERGGINAKHTPWYNPTKLMFAPRLGFAWTPRGRQDLVIRGGYGMFYAGLDYGDNFWGTPQAGDAISHTWTTIDNGVTPAFKLSQGFPPPVLQLKTDAFGAVPIGQAPTFAPTFYWENPPATYAQQMNLSIQKKFGANLLEVGYLGNITRKRPLGLNFNEVSPERRGPGNAQIRRPFPQFGGVRGSGVAGIDGVAGADSNYHAGLIQLKRHFSSGLSFQTNYTFGKHLADSTSPFSRYGFRRAHYGPSSLERRHRFVWSSVYELPWGPGKRWLSAGPVSNILGGWTLGSIVNLESGQWLTVTNLFNTCNCFGGNQGVNRLGDPKAGVDHGQFDPNRNTWFNTAAFGPPAPFTYGNALDPLIQGPGQIIIDLTADKRFRVSETVSAEIRGEFFNLPNHTNFGNPNTTLGSAAFGRISSAQPGRRLQVGVKLFFGPY